MPDEMTPVRLRGDGRETARHHACACTIAAYYQQRRRELPFALQLRMYAPRVRDFDMWRQRRADSEELVVHRPEDKRLRRLSCDRFIIHKSRHSREPQSILVIGEKPHMLDFHRKRYHRVLLIRSSKMPARMGVSRASWKFCMIVMSRMTA